MPYFYMTEQQINEPHIKEMSRLYHVLEEDSLRSEERRNLFIKGKWEDLGISLREGYIPLGLYSFPNYPDGLVRTSVHQLSRFLQMYMKEGNYDGTRILNENTVRSMLSENHFGRGLCWDKVKYKGAGYTWGHDGTHPGVSTWMMFRKTDNVGVILFMNTLYEDINKIIQLLFEKAEKE